MQLFSRVSQHLQLWFDAVMAMVNAAAMVIIAMVVLLATAWLV